ncbi:hypothetical protein V6N13_039881 [Hibiscus sabdariffa]
MYGSILLLRCPCFLPSAILHLPPLCLCCSKYISYNITFQTQFIHSFLLLTIVFYSFTCLGVGAWRKAIKLFFSLER